MDLIPIPNGNTPPDIIGEGDDHFERIEASNVLEPGQFWRCAKECVIEGTDGFFRSNVTPNVGDIHLVTKLVEFEGTLHSVIILGHPRYASGDRFGKFTILAKDFFESFEKVTDEEAASQRAQEQAAVMDEVQSIQKEMLEAQVNPLQLPGVQEAAQNAVERFEREEAARVQSEVRNKEQRDADLRRIHRRAARRSEAKSNPIAVRKTTISDRLDVMISEGVTEDGVRELQIEAGRRLAIAQATAKWLQDRSKDMGEVLKQLTPYAAEQGQVALARASESIDLVNRVGRGIASLNLYTGTGVDVYQVREGADAPSSEPLTIVQGKIAMDEELAVHVDVEESFDCSSTPAFFRRLADNDALLDQVLPTLRCVVSVQVTRRSVEYGEKMNPYERMAREIENKRVFLLVRNGHNVHAVYSCEPSHEAAHRLFPTRDDLKQPFRGIDGSTIGLQDVAFGKAAGRFEDQALHYRRFLILLCGLDHRLNLFGEFAPPEEKMAFMTQAFQQRYLRFLENDDPGLLLGGQCEYVGTWMRRHNQAIRSGSRVVVDSGVSLSTATALVRKVYGARIDRAALDGTALIASEKAGAIFLQVPVTTDNGDKKGTAWLTGPEAYREHDEWWLCIDRLKLPEVRRYIYDRDSRISSIAWLRTLRRVERVLVADEEAQAPTRAYIRAAALDAKVLSESEIDEAIDQAIATWRADHRGAPVPTLDDKKGMAQLMSLVFPAASLAANMQPIIEALCAKHSIEPLMLTRTGKNQMALYSIVPLAERQAYGAGVAWGWVRRRLLKVTGNKASLGSESTVWLQGNTLTATEEIVLRYPELDAWVHEGAEPIRLTTLRKAHEQIQEGSALLKALDAARSSGNGIDQCLFADWLARAYKSAERLSYTQNFYLSIPIGLYQIKSGIAPKFLYARASFVDLVRHYGNADQLEKLLSTRGFRSNSVRAQARSTKPIHWRPITTDYLATSWLQRDGEMGRYDAAPWAALQTNAPGGYMRKELGNSSTRSERRAKGGSPRHREVQVNLSWSRAIDHLMGIAPIQSRSFYRNVDKRVKNVWLRMDGTRDEYDAKRKAERVKRFDAPVKAAVEIAPCLWDEIRGRSVANRYLSGRCIEKKAG